jgi:hypothetical protein
VGAAGVNFYWLYLRILHHLPTALQRDTLLSADDDRPLLLHVLSNGGEGGRLCIQVDAWEIRHALVLPIGATERRAHDLLSLVRLDLGLIGKGHSFRVY